MDQTLETTLKKMVSQRKSDIECQELTDTVSQLDQKLEHDVKLVCDEAFREELQKLFSSNDDPATSKVNSLITYAITVAQQGLTSTNMPIALLGDAFELYTLKQCEQLFAFVEDNVPTWTQSPFYNSGKNTLLRMCNDLLRRLSKSQKTVFCGRIQMFLARLFPLEEKSALNLASHFNLENVTMFKKSPLESDTNDDKKDDKSSAAPVDFGLYIKFWSLQDYFRNPVKCFKILDWKMMKQCVSQILKVFEDQKIEYVKRKRRRSQSSIDVTLSDVMRDSDISQYFPKFLTNEKLMDLQLSDSNFRRHILAQMLVLFQYLTGNVKFKQSAQVLNDQQLSWIDDATAKVYQSLRECPPDGDVFASSVKHFLAREENWITWKNDGCPSFVKTSQSEDPTEEEPTDPPKKVRRKSVGEDLIDTANRKADLGNAELSRLWNICPDNLESCKAESREKFLPLMKEFFAEAIEQADPDAQIDDEYKVINKSSFGWHALRLMARRSHHFFTASNQPFKPIPEYLGHFVSLLAKESPSTQPTSDK